MRENKNPLVQEWNVENKACRILAEWNAIGSGVEEFFGMKVRDLVHVKYSNLLNEWMNKNKGYG